MSARACRGAIVKTNQLTGKEMRKSEAAIVELIIGAGEFVSFKTCRAELPGVKVPELISDYVRACGIALGELIANEFETPDSDRLEGSSRGEAIERWQNQHREAIAAVPCRNKSLEVERVKALPRCDYIQEGVNALLDKLELIRDDIAKPSRELLTAAFDSCITRRRNKRGFYGWRKSAPGRDNRAHIRPEFAEVGDQLFKLLKFHRGSGSLWGYPWEYRTSEYNDALDTAAMVMLNGSTAAESWSKVFRDK